LHIINAAFLSDGFSKTEANQMKFFSGFGLTALTEQVTRVAFAIVMLLLFQLISGQAIADARENKFYAPGIGNIRTVDLVTGESSDLIDIITE
jgi:hypothetical protein